MDFFFADDSRQATPSRARMGPLVGIGGIRVPDEQVPVLEKALNDICKDFGFPGRESFKWSPGRELWMRDNLRHPRREEFFLTILELAKTSGVKALVIAEDTGHRRATAGAPNPEADVTRLFLERVHNELVRSDKYGVVVVARPTGDRSDEDRFLADCLETIASGTAYVKPDHIALNVLSAHARVVRLLQLADVVASCSIAALAGEKKYAPPVFEAIKLILVRDSERIGGIGFKVHPDYIYANIYHWLLGDSHFWKRACGIPMPMKTRPYGTDPLKY
ncbi:MAG: DUF3800 domain-containing protein [Nitrospirae bacterium]|nr:MAG: DUF3800 domain-containing protein [Nitrospirota bacterium]